MSARQQERYFWLKLPNDFFDNHTLRILRGMDGGQYALLLYIELLAESVTRDGRLRCSEKVAYDEAMIASMFGFSEEQVKRSFALLKKFELMIIEKDGTLIFPELGDMVGNETRDAARKRKEREERGLVEDIERIEDITTEDKERKKRGKCPQEIRVKSKENKKEERENIHSRSCEDSQDNPKSVVVVHEKPKWEEVLRVVRGQKSTSTNPISEKFAKEWYDTAEMSLWRDTHGMDMRIPHIWRRKLQFEWNEELKRQREKNSGKTDQEVKREQEASDEWSRRCLLDERED